MSETAPRATDVLRAHHIPYTYWYEYALRHHGSKTVLFSVYLLVDSVTASNTRLQSAGWVPGEVPMYTSQYYDPAIDEQVVLEYPGIEWSHVVLMEAHTWADITPSAAADDRDHYPTLVQLYNALAQRFLDTDCFDHRQHLNVHIAYMYMHCPPLTTPEFLARLPADIQQFHFDYLSDDLRMNAPKTRLRDLWWPEGSVSLGGLPVPHELEAQWAAEVEKKYCDLYPEVEEYDDEEAE
ncbi:hypothetical protein TRAPUB_5030 [Trametes pubescens]|uniref:Uncharacterized protein n=1 Tax=Trametes pubescens TaxID=154538 RepID=A0A1M2V999_TRAPU|nr:hypothetical protein TRAPUB_5030 [Trametes pubescens]